MADRAYHKLALKQLADKQPKLAIKTLRAGLKPDKKFARGHYDLARAFALAKKPRDAVRSLIKAVQLERALRKEASKDIAFARLEEDVEFIELVTPDHLLARSARALREGTPDEIIEVLDKLGDEIPYRLMGYGFAFDSELLPVEEAFMQNSLPPDALERIANRVLESDDREGASLLWMIYARQSGRHLDRLRARLLQRYIERKVADGIDQGFVGDLINWEPRDGARTLYACLTAHPDRWSQLAELIATLIDRAPERERAQLVAFVDEQLNGKSKQTTKESAKARYLRIMRALPPPKIRLNDDPDDDWAGERVAVAHPHPGVAIPMAKHLLIQEPEHELRDEVFAQRNALLAYALDDTVSAELRAAAAAVLRDLGDKQSLAALARASKR